MKIGAHDTKRSIVVVAEVGNNHEGRIDVARELVRKAAEAGADIVKFQTFRTELFQSPHDEARVKRLRSFELTQRQVMELHDLARSSSIGFMSTPLDFESLRFLIPIVDAIKIASGDNNFVPLIERAAASNKPVIVSSGMTNLTEIKRAIAPLANVPHAVLHCVSSYPAPDDEIHLRAIPLLERELGCPIGYSDHTLGVDACLAAVALGARIIEKHFTLDKHFSDFRDHQLSATPEELASLVVSVRRVEKMLGTAKKDRQRCEEAIEPMARRSIVASRDLPAGSVLSEESLLYLRPAGGLSPGERSALLGKTLTRAIAFGDRISKADLE